MESAFQPCPVCANVIELRFRDLLRRRPVWICATCHSKLSLDFRKKGWELLLPGLLMFLVGLFLASSDTDPKWGFVFSWKFWIWFLTAILTTKLVVALFAGSRVPLVPLEELSAMDHCPYCKGILEKKHFGQPWRIYCPQCGKRLIATVASHCWMIVSSAGFGMGFGRIAIRDLRLPTEFHWPAVIVMFSAFYLFVAPSLLRIQRPATMRTPHAS